MSSSAANNTISGRVDLGGGGTGDITTGTETVARVKELAEQIWKEVKRSGVPPDDDEGNDRLLTKLQKKHKDFAMSFPIAFRWMVEAREYNSAAFEKYLKNHVKAMYKDRGEFMEAQAEYLILLYKARRPRAGAKELQGYREMITKSLKKDDDTFTAAWEEAKEEVKRLDAERRRRVMAFVARLGSTPEGRQRLAALTRNTQASRSDN